MKYEEIEPHLIDYLRGTADEAVEYRIKAYLEQHPQFRKEMDELRETLDFFQEAPLHEPEPSLKMNFYAMLDRYEKTTEEKTPKLFWENLLAWV
ncbi:MAG: hypothetical protein HC880_05715 [Bacteroidia bacterium]|nr:hypothetical protein [Bacteroidia bacterium]